STTSPQAVPLAEFRNVTKWYGPVIGVNDISVTLGPGITGLLGPNGAGKTTLIKLLTGQLHPSLGKVLVGGHQAFSAIAKRRLGYCPDVDTFYEEMSGRRFVQTMARLHGMDARTARERSDAALEQVGMADRADRRLRGYSKGMRQRIKLAQALIHNPDLLIVDEPLNGVDPVGRRELMDLFRRFRDQGKAVLVSSHILDEMETLADRVVFMGRGRIVAIGTLPEIRNMLDEYPLHIRIRAPRVREVAVELVQWPLVRSVALRTDEELSAEVLRPDEFFRQFAGYVAVSAAEINALETTDVSAEAIFEYVMSSSRKF
ncbi:MAG: ABC transporter ATP-binding protein, partial [Planctomycetaceae bacterium]